MDNNSRPSKLSKSKSPRPQPNITNHALQLLLPLLQGTLWSFLQLGWRHWNAAANLSGNTLGSRIRRWWYKTNNWSLPTLNNMKKGVSKVTKDRKLAEEMAEVSKAFLNSMVINKNYFAVGFLREFSSGWNFWG